MKFFDAHKPVLTDDTYTIKVTQDIGMHDYVANTSAETSMNSTLMFTVNGPRFKLSPDDILSQFPHPGAKGDFQNFLPYVVLNRSTLPWERKPFEDYDGSASWLFLLVVDEDDLKANKISESIKKKTDIASNLSKFGIIEPSDLDLLDQDIQVNVLTLDDSNLSYIPKSLDDLSYLSYVRIKDTKEEAVILANRLPKPGINSIVYLISLENKFDITNSKWIDTYFVYLQKWKFYTENEQLYSFGNGNYNKAIQADSTLTGVLEDICATDSTVAKNFQDFTLNKLKSGQTLSDSQIKTLKHSCKLPGSTFHEILSNLKGGTNFLIDPYDDNPIAKSGSTTIPWQHTDDAEYAIYDNAKYRGPLVPKLIDLNFSKNNSTASFNKIIKIRKNDTSNNMPCFVYYLQAKAFNESGYFPVNAEELLITYNGATDHSYAAAYELGKLTALNDTVFSSAFYEWKMNVYNQAANSKNDNTQHLAVSNTITISDLPIKLQAKFNDWKLLKGLPFRYLVPNPDFLPPESLRIFQIDPNWVNAFICGAFSIGYTPKCEKLNQKLIGLFLTDTKYGFLINSLAVKAWPDYELEVYPGSTPVGMDLNPDFSKNLNWKKNLDPSTHIYIFDSPFDTLKFHLHPGKLLPGFMLEDGDYWKNGEKINADNPVIDTNTRVMNLDELKTKAPQPVTASSFNSWLMEGTPEVVFTFK